MLVNFGAYLPLSDYLMSISELQESAMVDELGLQVSDSEFEPR